MHRNYNAGINQSKTIIQVTDTVYPERIYSEGNWIYKKFIPDVLKGYK